MTLHSHMDTLVNSEFSYGAEGAPCEGQPCAVWKATWRRVNMCVQIKFVQTYDLWTPFGLWRHISTWGERKNTKRVHSLLTDSITLQAHRFSDLLHVLMTFNIRCTEDCIYQWAPPLWKTLIGHTLMTHKYSRQVSLVSLFTVGIIGRNWTLHRWSFLRYRPKPTTHGPLVLGCCFRLHFKRLSWHCYGRH